MQNDTDRLPESAPAVAGDHVECRPAPFRNGEILVTVAVEVPRRQVIRFYRQSNERAGLPERGVAEQVRFLAFQGFRGVRVERIGVAPSQLGSSLPLVAAVAADRIRHSVLVEVRRDEGEGGCAMSCGHP